MLSGEEPDQQAARAFDVAFILYADHTMNASTFCARIVASTLADMHSAVVAAVAPLKGPPHRGGNEQAMRMLEGNRGGNPPRGHGPDPPPRPQRIMGVGTP